MNVRPKRTDTEDDVLEMQKKFFAEKEKQANFKPAAMVLKVQKPKKQSLFAKSRSHEVKPDPSSIASKNILLGDIVEKPTSILDGKQMEVDMPESQSPFPTVEKINIKESSGGKSLFALSMERKRTKDSSTTPGPEQPSIKTLKDNYGESSLLVQNSETAHSIHKENLELISQMKQEEILAERERLLKSLDPNLLKFIEERRKKKIETEKGDAMKQPPPKESEEQNPSQPQAKQAIDPMEAFRQQMQEQIQVPTVTEILEEVESEKWLHFDVIEKDKFEWMKDVPAQAAKLKPGENFEARFDWKGVLLPYTESQNETKDDRELYLHGEEPHRPGYTLQELFRLCRSNIIQQRVSAFGAICGILNIYNQGFYDQVLDLPVTKIFFLLRFGFDENFPVILEIVSRSLAMLFYNETDEILLDLITESPEGYLQPILNVEQKTSDNIENVFSKMKLTSTPFSTKIEENEEESKTSMNDFQLAETDLIECFLRTNIIQRIYYILGIVRPDNSTVFSCLKILIRIARTSREACNQIATNTELMKVLFEYFLPRFESICFSNGNEIYRFPQFLVLKLFRIMISQHISFCINLTSYGLLDRIKDYLYSREDIRNKLIKVQLESLRILRSLMLLNMGGAIYRDLLPAFRFMLEWHYGNVEFDEGRPFLIRQHASALLNAIHSGTLVDAVPILGEKIAMCSCKWFYEATKLGIKEFSQSTLLSATLNCVSRFMTVAKAQYMDFINRYLRQFIQSKTFIEFSSNLRYPSVLLKKSMDRRNVHPPLLNCGTILLTDGSPQLIISQKYPIYLLNSILNVNEVLHTSGENIVTDIIKNIEIIECLTNYVKHTSKYINKNLGTSFVAKAEIRLLFKILCFKPIHEIMPKEIILEAAYNLICCMTPEHIVEIEILFNDILFNGNNLQFDGKTLTRWKDIFLEAFVYPQRIIIPATEISLSMPCFQTTILPLDWPYMPLKSLLNKYLQQISETIKPDTSELSASDIISVTLQFTELLEKNGLIVTSPTEKLMYLMISFMGPNSEFLEPNMKQLLKESVQNFFSRSKNIKFKFDAVFEDKCKFENLFVLFLDHFQAASYGDASFSSLVLVPLAQKYDNKWRKMVWSEHASVLRFLNCDESELLGGIENYLQPIETDESLIKCYIQALSSNLLRPNTTPYKIAEHHVKHYVPNKTIEE